jgi:hypothetical protein
LVFSPICAAANCVLAAERSSDRERAIADIKLQGGKVAIDKNSPDKPVVGVEFFDPGRSAASMNVFDAVLDNLKALPQLRNLDISHTKITDAGLEYLKGFSQLQELGLMGTKTTDDGKKSLLKSLPNCKLQTMRA